MGNIQTKSSPLNLFSEVKPEVNKAKFEEKRKKLRTLITKFLAGKNSENVNIETFFPYSFNISCESDSDANANNKILDYDNFNDQTEKDLNNLLTLDHTPNQNNILTPPDSILPLCTNNFSFKQKPKNILYNEHSPIEQYRSKYFLKLYNNQFFRKEKTNICQQITIFDWDDTLMCTSEVNVTGVFNQSMINEYSKKKDHDLFDKIDDELVYLLTKALDSGHVYIVTNAVTDWVEISSKLFFPKLFSILCKVVIISARNWFNKEFPNSPFLWKKACFEEIAKTYCPDKLTNVIVIGDSLNEMKASQAFSSNISLCYVKKIKVNSNPSPLILFNQLKTIKELYSFIEKDHVSCSYSLIKDKLHNVSLIKIT